MCYRKGTTKEKCCLSARVLACMPAHDKTLSRLGDLQQHAQDSRCRCHRTQQASPSCAEQLALHRALPRVKPAPHHEYCQQQAQHGKAKTIGNSFAAAAIYRFAYRSICMNLAGLTTAFKSTTQARTLPEHLPMHTLATILQSANGVEKRIHFILCSAVVRPMAGYCLLH